MKTKRNLTHSRPARSKWLRLAFTLAEVLVAITVSSLLMIAIAGSMSTVSRMFANLVTHYDLQMYDRRTASLFTRDIREARKIKSFDGATLTLVDDTDREVTYAWDSNSRTVSRSGGDLTTVVLTGCTKFTVNFFARPGTNAPGDFGTLTPTSATNAGVLEAWWTCVRNTNSVMREVAETVTSGKIEIRTH